VPNRFVSTIVKHPVCPGIKIYAANVVLNPLRSLSTEANILASPSHPVTCYDAIIYLKQLRCVIIKTPVVIAMVHLSVQMIKGS